VRLAARRTPIVDLRWAERVEALVAEAEGLLDAAARRDL
jgi:hypothetical protein